MTPQMAEQASAEDKPDEKTVALTE